MIFTMDVGNTNIVLTTVAITIGQNCASITSKYNIRATPGGTKKKPRLATKKSDNPCTHFSLTHFNFKNKVSNNIPMMLEGSFTPVR